MVDREALIAMCLAASREGIRLDGLTPAMNAMWEKGQRSTIERIIPIVAEQCAKIAEERFGIMQSLEGSIAHHRRAEATLIATAIRQFTSPGRG